MVDLKAIDFEYDGMLLSDFGFIICDFNGNSGVQTITDSEMSVNSISALNGRISYKTSINYDNNLIITFQICKIPSEKNGIILTYDEVRTIKRWLERKEYKKFKFVGENRDYSLNFYYEGIFNVSQIEIGNRICGLELSLNTNRPFAVHDTVKFKLEWTAEEMAAYDDSGDSIYRTIVDNSDEIGAIYPRMKITCLRNGTFQIYNNHIGRGYCVIKNCKKNEVITINYPMITSSDTTHDLANDFNFEFLKIGNDFKNRANRLEIKLPSIVEIEYNPVVKVGI